MYLKIKRMLSTILVACFVITNIQCVYAVENQDVRRYVVILEEPAVYSEDRPKVFARSEEDYNNQLRIALEELQNDIKAQIPATMTLDSEQDVFEDEFSYTDVLNGFTITTDSETAQMIENIDGVKEVFPDKIIAYAGENELDSTTDSSITESATTDTSVGFSAANPGNEINVQYAYENGYNGKGRTVAILDSTINYNNSYFKLSDETTAKYTVESLSAMMEAKGINKSASQAYKNAKVPYLYDYANNEYDTKSSSHHGTHVSGIAAGYELKVGDGKITGIAPEAQIMFFGVTSINGGISFSVAAAALDDAVKLEADAINMSFGLDYGSENNPGPEFTAFKNAAVNAVNAGCILSKSAGNLNKGEVTQTKDIDYSATDNTLFPNTVNVGSVHGRFRVAKGLTDENGVVYGAESKSSSVKFSLSEIVDCKNGTAADLTSTALSGKAAIVTIPDEVLRETDYAYYNRIYSKGASALIFVNNSNQIPDTTTTSYYKIPVFYMTKTEGEKLLSNAKQISCVGKLLISKNSENVQASISSAYGYSDKLDISIDYSSPGGNIYSAFNAGVSCMSGTSMAAPGASGAGVLMNQYVEEKYPGYTGSEKVKLIKNLLASTAETVYEENGAMASPRKVGSGVIQLDKAMQSGVVVEGINNTYQNKLTLGDEVGKEFSLKFFIRNISDKQITFDKIETELSTDDYKYYEEKGIYAFYGIKKLNASVSGTSNVTVMPGKTSLVSLTVTLDDADIEYLEKAMVNGFFVDGKVSLSSTAGEHVSVGIPFTGFYGDWEKYSPVDETKINKDFVLRTTMDYCSIDSVIAASEDGYILPFTTEPDEFVKNSPLSLVVKMRKNTFVRIKADGIVIYNGFVLKNNALNLKTFVTEIGALSETLEKNGKVVWEFYFMSPQYKTENEAQKIKITVMPQNEKPEFGEIEITEFSGKKYLNVPVSGKDLGAIICIGHDTEGNEKISKNYMSGNTFTTAFNIDGLSDVSLLAYDCALNSVAENSGITLSVEDNKAIFKNNTLEQISYTGIIATYDNTGKMELIDIITEDDEVLSAYQRREEDISSYIGKNYKIFFLESIKSLKPYCSAID